MRDYEEKSYYEIQLDNKQLILVFLAAITVCVLIFVLGVMIGKGQKEAEFAAAERNEKKAAAAEPAGEQPQQIISDTASAEEQSAPPEPVAEKPVPEKRVAPKPVEEKPVAAKQQPKEVPKQAAVSDSASSKKKEAKKPEQKKEEKYAYEELDKTEQPAAATKEKATKITETDILEENELKSGGASQYTVQVMATSSKPRAQDQITKLKSRGYKPFMDESKSGDTLVFKVRVGRFTDSEEAKKVATKIKSDFKLETWVALLD